MSQSEGRRVLVADANEDTSLIITMLLTQAGYETVVVRTAREAVRRAQGEPFDAFVIDDRLPDGTSAELCRQLGGIAEGAPVVIHTSDPLASERVEASCAGARAYLVKPLGIFKLVPTLAALLCLCLTIHAG